jgi:uncharacterized phage protein (TIGR01671 family)
MEGKTMREILFRGKRLDNRGWVEGWLYKRVVHLEGCHQNVVVDAIEVYDGKNPLSISYYTVDPDTVGEYTGMTDMAGRKIFEGDLLSATINAKTGKHKDQWGFEVWDTEKQETVWSVEWKNFNAQNGFRVYGKDRRFNISLSNSVIINGDCRVIGNIHDNPELLDGGDAG